MQYIAIIGDVVQSKRLFQRSEIQVQLKRLLDAINTQYAASIAANFIVTLGDEFQGLLASAKDLLPLIDTIRYRLYPVKVRFGVGIGEVVTAIDRNMCIGADGPAFWHARKAIELIHDENRYGIKTVRISSEATNPTLDLANRSLALCDFLESTWTERQGAFMRQYLLHYGYRTDITQKQLAEEERISVQAINKRIQSIGFYPYLEMKQSLNTVLGSLI